MQKLQALQYFKHRSEWLTHFFPFRWTYPCTRQGSALHTPRQLLRPMQSSLGNIASGLKRARSGTGSTWTPYTPAECSRPPQARRHSSETFALSSLDSPSRQRRESFFGSLPRRRVCAQLVYNAGFRFPASHNAARICDNINHSPGNHNQ